LLLDDLGYRKTTKNFLKGCIMSVVNVSSKILHNSDQSSTYSTTWDTYLQPSDQGVLLSGQQAWDVEPGKLAAPIYLEGDANLGLYGNTSVTLRLMSDPSVQYPERHIGQYGGFLDVQGNTAVNVTAGGAMIVSGILEVQISAADTFTPTGSFVDGGTFDIWYGTGGSGSVQGANLQLYGGARGQFWVDMTGTNTFNMDEGSGKYGSPSMDVGSVAVSDGTTINLNGGTLTLWDPMRFLGTIHNGPAQPNPSLGGGPNVVMLQGMSAASVSVAAAAITFFDAAGAVEKVLNYGDTKASIGVGAAGVLISDEGLYPGYTAIPAHIA